MNTIWKKFRGIGLAVGMLLLAATSVESEAVASEQPSTSQSVAVSAPQDSVEQVSVSAGYVNPAVYYIQAQVSIPAVEMYAASELLSVGPSSPTDHRAMRGVYYAHDRLANLKVRYMMPGRTDSRPHVHSYI